jgi:hypothetical protein
MFLEWYCNDDHKSTPLKGFLNYLNHKILLLVQGESMQSRPKNYLATKMESGHQVGLGILKFKISFTLMFNYMKFFDFVITIF